MIKQLIIKIAERFVFDRKSDLSQSKGFVSLIAGISVIGLSLGVTALLVVTSVMNGFELELKKALTAFHGHIMLVSRDEPIQDQERIISEIKKSKQVVAVSPYVLSEVMLSSRNGNAGAVVEGVDLPTIDGVSEVRKKIVEGEMPFSGRRSGVSNAAVTLGTELALKLNVKIGDNILLTIPFAKEGEGSLVQKLTVVGIVKFGMYDYDSKYALIEISEFQKILGSSTHVNAFKILTKDSSESLKTTAELNDRFSYPLRAKDWSSLNRNLFYAIRLQKVVIAVLLLAIVLVAAFNIISTIMMLVHDKKRQISILKAMGLAPKYVFGIFIFIGSLLSAIGALLGVGFGFLLCKIVEWKSIIDLPGDIYLLTRLHTQVRVGEWVFIVTVAVGLAIAATLWPSLKISRESPVEGIRFE